MIRSQKTPRQSTSSLPFNASFGASDIASMGIGSKPILFELNSIVENSMKNSEILKTLNPRKDFIVSFIELLEQIPREISKRAFDNIHEKVGYCFAL